MNGNPRDHPMLARTAKKQQVIIYNSADFTSIYPPSTTLTLCNHTVSVTRLANLSPTRKWHVSNITVIYPCLIKSLCCGFCNFAPSPFKSSAMFLFFYFIFFRYEINWHLVLSMYIILFDLWTLCTNFENQLLN